MRRGWCVEGSSGGVVEDLGTTRPAYRTLWMPLLGLGSIVVVAVVDRVVPPALRRAVRKGRFFLLHELCPAVPPAEQDMREVGLPLSRVVRNRGVPRVVHSGAFAARVVHRFRFAALWLCDSCCASSSDAG